MVLTFYVTDYIYLQDNNAVAESITVVNRQPISYRMTSDAYHTKTQE